jgi:hypothetical protein
VHGDRPGGPIRWRMHLPVLPELVYHLHRTLRPDAEPKVVAS